MVCKPLGVFSSRCISLLSFIILSAIEMNTSVGTAREGKGDVVIFPPVSLFLVIVNFDISFVSLLTKLKFRSL